eukprot:scaffold34605_cov151-Amphora_coffeaeformis.AAC.4
MMICRPFHRSVLLALSLWCLLLPLSLPLERQGRRLTRTRSRRSSSRNSILYNKTDNRNNTNTGAILLTFDVDGTMGHGSGRAATESVHAAAFGQAVSVLYNQGLPVTRYPSPRPCHGPGIEDRPMD